MTNDEILQAAKEDDLSKYLRSYSEFDEIAEQAGCDMSAMDGREYETMWCDRAQFEKLCIDISAIIEKRTIERCAEECDYVSKNARPSTVSYAYKTGADECAAAIRAME